MFDSMPIGDVEDGDITEAIADLREEALRLVLFLTAAVYAAWQFFSTTEAPADEAGRTWIVAPVVVAGLVGSYALRRRRSRWAVHFFVASSALSLTAAASLLQSSQPLALYPAVALAAVVLLHPLAGVAAVVGTQALAWLGRALGPLAFVEPDRLLEVAALSAFTVALAWTLARSMAVAVAWALQGYGRAAQTAREAQEHRAKLVRALRQLDDAYYRLQRASATLEVAWKTAEAAERSKSEFVTTLSHELRTPLNLIVGFSEMILTSQRGYGAPLPADYRGDLTAIYRNAQHLLKLTNDVIDLARIGAGRLALARDAVSVERIVADACEVVREYVEAKGLRLEAELPEGLPTVPADPLRVRQVLLNLLTNAARFTQEGVIRVSAAPEADAVVVRVTDTGPGIAAAELTRVFDEFEHGEGGRSALDRGLGGVGLGLPISRRFVELHGGRMGVESQVGIGTTFWFTLPTAPTTLEASDGAWHPMRTFGVEDDRAVVLASTDRAVADFLRQHLRGYRVLPAPTLQRAFAVAREELAIAVLADGEDPAVRGLSERRLPFITLPLPHTERLARALGALAYLTKPVTRADVDRVLVDLRAEPRMVLVVDDDARFVRFMRRLLETVVVTPGLEVLTAHSGEEALALMADRAPDIVFMDLHMPGLGGEGLRRAMLQRPELAGVPVVVVSAQDQVASQFPVQGALCVTTPDGFRLEELLGTLEAVLGVVAESRRPISRAGIDAARRPRRRGARSTPAS